MLVANEIVKTTVNNVIETYGVRGIIFSRLTEKQVSALITKIKKEKVLKNLIDKLEQIKGAHYVEKLDVLSKNLSVEQFKKLIANSKIEKHIENTFSLADSHSDFGDLKLPTVAQLRKVAKTKKLSGKFWTSQGSGQKTVIYDADTDTSFKSSTLNDNEAFNQLLLVENKKKK